jgi:hypothetical protein
MGSSLFQPAVLTGDSAERFLEGLQLKSIVFGTRLSSHNGIGYIDLRT